MVWVRIRVRMRVGVRVRVSVISQNNISDISQKINMNFKILSFF